MSNNEEWQVTDEPVEPNDESLDNNILDSIENAPVTTSDEYDAIVIGGGISGIATLKILLESGLNTVLLEKSGDVGGLWKFRKDYYGVMKFTHINVSKYNYSFSDFPFPKQTTDFPHNQEMAQYIDDYVNHFQLNKSIKYHTTVQNLQQKGNGWIIDAEEESESGSKSCVFKANYVAVASGHHAKPNIVSFPGQDKFKGEIIHSVKFKDVISNDCVEKNVVVVGIGNSAVDVAVNCVEAGRCRPVHISTRSGAWIFPNYLFGQPIDLNANRLIMEHCPRSVSGWMFESLISALYGHPKKWGLNPKMGLLESQPTVSPTLIHRIQRGEIKIKPNIKEFREDGVVFTDDSFVTADRVVMCTGYRINLPFLSDKLRQQVMGSSTNELNLYKNVFSPTIGSSLAFIGFVQPASGGILSMSEVQAMWFAELCRGQVQLPPETLMKSTIQEETERTRKMYYSSPRHTIQRDPLTYCDEIADMIKAKPEISKNPTLAWRLLLSSCGPAQYRLQGPFRSKSAISLVREVPVAVMNQAVGYMLVAMFLYLIFKLFCCC